MPLEALGHIHSSILQPVLDPVPVHTLVEGVAVRSWLIVLVDPVVRDDARVKVAHETLAEVVDAVLVVALIHLRGALLVGFCLGEVGGVVVLPDVVEAVDVMCSHGYCEVAPADLRRVLHGGQVVPNALDVFGCDADGSICTERKYQPSALWPECHIWDRRVNGVYLHSIRSAQALLTSGVGGPL